MRLGIIGLPNSGKTTLFNALTGGNIPTSPVSSGQFEVNTAIVNVPDERVDKLAEMYQSKKKVYTTITYTDIGGLDKGVGKGGLSGAFRTALQQVDGFVHVLRVFRSETVPHPYNSVDPQRDLEILDSEFLLLDTLSIETRLEKVQNELRIKGKRAEKLMQEELPLLEKLKAHVDSGAPLRNLDLTNEELKLIGGYGFLTLKPVLIVLNLGDQVREQDRHVRYSYRRAKHIAIQAALEAELAQLPPEDAALFMEEYGIRELSAAQVIRLSYELLGIHSFLTAGDKESRAWSIPQGATAWEAAGAIHSDIQAGFIRAEVTAYRDLIELGSEKAVKAAGKMRLESKEYVVQDGDVMVFRHSN